MVDAADQPAGAGLAWSEDVGQASWIGARLAPFGSGVVSSVVPGGFPAYARVLHPAEDPYIGDRVVRWAAVAAWSGMPLRSDSQFHSIALPPVRPASTAPWSGQGPRRGSMYPPDAEVLAELLRPWTTTPDECWFCLWDGYGWDNVQVVFATPIEGDGQPEPPGESRDRVPDPIPAAVRQGPRVQLPNRDYLLYRGPVEAAVATVGLASDEQTPNLWWPEDRAWCVATEIDLPWTYVGGHSGLIDRLVSNDRIEALPVGPEDSMAGIEDWVARWAAQATTDLLASGAAVITTSRGAMRAWLTRPAGRASGMLRTQSEGDNGVTGSTERRLHGRGEQELRDEVRSSLSWDIIGLVES
jgi:hypothetical protein